MPFNRLSTAKVARSVGVHPNTVRLYEALGWIAPVPRSPSGYRLFNEMHLAQMRLARMVLAGPWPGRNIRRSAMKMITLSAGCDMGGALEQAYRHLAIVQSEQAQAEAAARLLERWAQGIPAQTAEPPLHIAAAAQLLALTPDILRNWERNGLLSVPRDPGNGYRLYGQAELSRLRVIRMLRQAGYSTMAILRMMLQLDRGEPRNLREALNTPLPGEDIYTAADQWLTTLAEQETRAGKIIAYLEEVIDQQVSC